MKTNEPDPAHEHHVHVHMSDERTAVDNFVGKMLGRQPAGKVGPQEALHKNKNRDRRARRAIQRADGSPDPRTSPHARLGRAKLAAPFKGPKQLALEEKAATRAYLSKIPVSALVADCPDMKFIAGVPGLRDTWQLSQAPSALIHSINGLGRVRRKKIHTYLVDKNVPVIWEP
jgi:hypothetical protein